MVKVKYIRDKDGNRVPITAEQAPLTVRNTVRIPRAPKISKDSRVAQRSEINKQRAAYERMLRKNLFMLRTIRHPWAPASIRFCRDLEDEAVRYRAMIVALDLRAEQYKDLPVRIQYRTRVRATLHENDVITDQDINKVISEVTEAAQARVIPPEEIDLGLDDGEEAEPAPTNMAEPPVGLGLSDNDD